LLFDGADLFFFLWVKGTLIIVESRGWIQVEATVMLATFLFTSKNARALPRTSDHHTKINHKYG
jgi:hypothetical protein